MVAALVILVPIIVAGIVAIIRTVQKRDDAQQVAIGDIHVLVNQRLTDVLARVEQLTARVEQLTEALIDSNTAVPEEPAEH